MKKQRNSLLRNMMHLLLSTVLSRGLNAITLLILAGYFSATQYGMFSVAFAFSMVAGYFTDVGLSNTVLREGMKQDAPITSLISSYIKIRSLLLLLTLLVSVVLIYSFYQSAQLQLTILSLIVPMTAGLALQSIGITYFQLTEQMHHLGIIRIVSAVLLIMLVGAGILITVGFFAMILLFGASYLIAGIYGLYMVWKELKWSLKLKFEHGLLHGLGVFLTGGLITMLLPQLGLLIVEKTLPLELIGLFALAYRIPSALYQVPGIVGGAFYPVLFQHHHLHEQEKHTSLNIVQAKLMTIIALALTLPFYHLSDFMISLLFGTNWLAAASLLKLLALLLILQGAGVALADGLTTKGLQTRRTGVQLITAIAGSVLYYTCSQVYGVNGAVYAALSLEAMLLVGFWLCNNKRGLIFKQVLFPYAFIAITTLKGAELLTNSGAAACLLSFALLVTGIYFDRDLRILAVNYINKRVFAKKQVARM